MINCLYDANAIIKYYFPALDKHQIVKYLLEESPHSYNNISTIQATEVLSLFYKARREGGIDTDDKLEGYKDSFFDDIKIGKLHLYDFAQEHLLDFPVYKTISETCPPPDRYITEYLPECKGFVRKLKNVANSADAIMLLTMREIYHLAEKKGKESFLITSDGHVKAVAEKMKIKVIDPERTPRNCIPPELDRRYLKRKNKALGAICKYPNDESTIMSTSTIDICDGGACIKSIGKLFDPKKHLSIFIYDYSNRDDRAEQLSEVIYSDKEKVRVKFIEPINIRRFIDN